MIIQHTVNSKPCEKYVWRIEIFSKVFSQKIYSDTFILSGYTWRLRIQGHYKYLSIYLEACNPAMYRDWARIVVKYAILNQDHASRTIVIKETGLGFLPRKTSWDEIYGKGFIVNNTCIVEVEISLNHVPVSPVSIPNICADIKHSDETSTRLGSLVDFRGLGKTENAFVPLLEEACLRHPSLVESQRMKNRTHMFTEWAFTALGRVLHFLETKKVKDMNEDACNQLKILWEELETVGFDLSWLEPHFQSAVSMKSYFERAATVKRLKENVDALKKDLKIAASNLAEAEKGFVEMDLDVELGFGAP